jgi:hypothetical protein
MLEPLTEAGELPPLDEDDEPLPLDEDEEVIWPPPDDEEELELLEPLLLDEDVDDEPLLEEDDEEDDVLTGGDELLSAELPLSPPPPQAESPIAAVVTKEIRKSLRMRPHEAFTSIIVFPLLVGLAPELLAVFLLIGANCCPDSSAVCVGMPYLGTSKVTDRIPLRGVVEGSRQ